jgi:hypothetical protein
MLHGPTRGPNVRLPAIPLVAPCHIPAVSRSLRLDATRGGKSRDAVGAEAGDA